jgi:hypothetical protein
VSPSDREETRARVIADYLRDNLSRIANSTANYRTQELIRLDDDVCEAILDSLRPTRRRLLWEAQIAAAMAALTPTQPTPSRPRFMRGN